MAEFFLGVSNFFNTILNFVSNAFESFFALFAMIPSAVATLGTILAYIPTPIAAFAFAAISISIVMLLIGR